MSIKSLSQAVNSDYGSAQQINNNITKQVFSNKLPVVSIDVTSAILASNKYNSIDKSNNYFSKNAVSKRDFKNSLKTKEGLYKHLNLLKTLFDEGIASSCQNAFKTDIILLHKMLWVIRKKYPDINLKVLKSGIEQLADKIKYLAENNTKSAQFIFGTNGLDTEANHFLMADYYLDVSSSIKVISIIFFDPTKNSIFIENLIDAEISEVFKLKDTLKIKYLYVPLNIQKSEVDCVLFSLEIAKAAHKFTNKMQHFHQLNISKNIETDEIQQLSQVNITTQYKFDQYVVTNIMKHCQSYTRIQLYNNKRKTNIFDIQKLVNKKGESIVDRYKRCTKNKYFNNKSISKKTSFSIEKQRISFLVKILQHWEEISSSGYTHGI